MKRENVFGGVKFGDLLFTSGYCVHADTIEQEIRQCMEGLGEILQKNGASFGDVIKATVFLRDLNDRERALNPIWSEYFPENAPARTCVEAGIGGSRIEIEFVVALPKS